MCYDTVTLLFLYGALERPDSALFPCFSFFKHFHPFIFIEEILMDKIAVLIPCYNEAPTIQKVVEDFRKALPRGGCICV